MIGILQVRLVNVIGDAPGAEPGKRCSRKRRVARLEAQAGGVRIGAVVGGYLKPEPKAVVGGRIGAHSYHERTARDAGAFARKVRESRTVLKNGRLRVGAGKPGGYVSRQPAATVAQGDYKGDRGAAGRDGVGKGGRFKSEQRFIR